MLLSISSFMPELLREISGYKSRTFLWGATQNITSYLCGAATQSPVCTYFTHTFSHWARLRDV